MIAHSFGDGPPGPNGRFPGVPGAAPGGPPETDRHRFANIFETPVAATRLPMPLLDAQDPPLYDIVNADGGSPLLICCDHAGRAIPRQLGDLGLDPVFLDRHIAYDIGARQVAKRLSAHFDAPLLLANYSRLVIDLNRHTDDATLIPAVSDHVAVPGNSDIDDEHRRARIDELFTPYHDRFASLVDDLVGRFERPVILSVHSFTPRIQGVDRPWHFGVLWDEQEDIARALMANLEAMEGLCIGDNQPYHACDPLGYAMCVHGQDRDVDLILMEIRQDLITDTAGQVWAADILHRAIDPLLDHRPAALAIPPESLANG